MKPELILVYESEKTCFDRLIAEGFVADRAMEITSYLAQSTDLSHEFDEISDAFSSRGLTFRPVELDDAPEVLVAADPRSTLVWTLCDGIAYYRGSVAPAIARLRGLRTIGSDGSLFALCQDKFRSGSVLSSLRLPVPVVGLARNGEWLLEPPAADSWFVKPNRLGAKIGIWKDSHCHSRAQALDLSRRIYEAYRDDTIVQPYVAGRNVRASFLAVEPAAGIEGLGVSFVDSVGDFLTMAESLALYGETGEVAKVSGDYIEPTVVDVASVQPKADTAIRNIADRLMQTLGVKDVYSMDLRVEPDDTVHLIEFEIAPGLPCFDFRSYCRTQWDMTLAEAMANAASSRLL